jgi:glycosyltransferase involved in cell wall biosynthesis
VSAPGSAESELVLVNGTSFHDRCVAGVQRYAQEMTKRLLAAEGVIAVVPRMVEDLPATRQLVRRPGFVSRALGPWSWIQRELLSSVGGQVLWSPTSRAPLGVPVHVPTVHDVSVLDHPEWFRRSFVNLHRVYIPRLVRGSRRVITVSAFSRDRIIDRFKVPADHVVVVHPGVDEMFSPAEPRAVDDVRRKYRLPQEYVLALGTLEPRKNLTRLLAAWNALEPAARSGVALVVAGESGRVFSESAPAADSDKTAMFLGRVPEPDLPALYSGATVFAYPSLYEGFGFPPLEAMACGTPVLSSDATATGEILRGAAVLVNPSDTSSIIEALRALLSDSRLREETSVAGLRRARTFSWDDSAERVLAVLREVA